MKLAGVTRGRIDFALTAAGEHILVAYGRDFDDVSPVAGILTGGGRHSVKVSVDVEEV